MAKFVRGDVVVVLFPFSDLTQAKRRPALVIATLEGDDVILCQITSKTIRDIYSIALDDTDFRTGGLRQPSNVRPNRIFTADNSIILYRVGSLKTAKTEEIEDGVVGIIRGEPLTPIARKQREGWSEAFKSMKRRGEDKLVVDDSVDLEMKDWEW